MENNRGLPGMKGETGMIRKLSEKDHEQLMTFLKKEPSMNLFMIGDVENYGYHSGFQELWGEFRSGGLAAVLLRYYESFVFYAPGDFDIEGFTGILKTYSDEPELSGKAEIVEHFESAKGLQFRKKRITYFAECRSDQLPGKRDPLVKKASAEDVDRIVELLRTIDEFDIREGYEERMAQKLRDRSGRTYYFEQDGKVVATASSTAENSCSAMIVSVATHKDYRRRGLATRCIVTLVRDLLDEGKYACLFYNNPEAGRIYRRIGFRDIGFWTMYN
jgi:Acetyltransferase (GNAT) family.